MEGSTETRHTISRRARLMVVLNSNNKFNDQKLFQELFSSKTLSWRDYNRRKNWYDIIYILEFQFYKKKIDLDSVS
jgi:hypothetical protein